jgi:hypothetical protein
MAKTFEAIVIESGVGGMCAAKQARLTLDDRSA